MLYTKYESSGPCSFEQIDFLKLTLLVGGHSGIIPVVFGQIYVSGSGEEVVCAQVS